MLSDYDQLYINQLSKFTVQEVNKAIKQKIPSFIIILNGYISPGILDYLKSSNIKLINVPYSYNAYGAHYTIWKYALSFD